MNGQIHIYSPSYKRAGDLKTHKLCPVRYVVHEFEADAYKAAGHDVVVCPDSERGNIARVRNWILDYAEELGQRRVLIIDDDIEAITEWRYDREEEKFYQHKLSPDEVEEFIEYGFDLAEQWGVRLWGLNCTIDKGSYREYTPFSNKSYVSGSFSGFIEPELRYDESIPLKEDYDMLLQQCNEYRKILRFNAFVLVKQDHENLGGCADYRTIEKEKEQLLDFQRKWGRRIVQTDNSTAVGSNKAKSYDINPIVKIPIKGV